VEKARQLFLDGKALPSCVKGRLKWELKLTWNGGWRILEKIENVHFDVFNHRPVLNKWDAPLLAVRVLSSR
jgi:hypothetical protein